LLIYFCASAFKPYYDLCNISADASLSITTIIKIVTVEVAYKQIPSPETCKLMQHNLTVVRIDNGGNDSLENQRMKFAKVKVTKIILKDPICFSNRSLKN
jgi:hypothetical protein